MRKRYRKIVRCFFLLVLLLGGGFTWWVSRAEQPPVAEMEEVRVLLASSRVAKASFYYPEEYGEARNLYKISLEKWRAENGKFIVSRNYDEVRQTAEHCRNLLENMLSRAEAFRKDSGAVLMRIRDSVRREMERLEPVFTVMPLPASVRRQHARGKLLLNEADIAFRKADYRKCARKTEEAVRSIGETYRTCLRELEAYFEDLPRWRGEVKEAVAVSRKEKNCVVVIEKFPPLCRIYDKGEEVHTFPAEFGKNWLGNKRYEGDGATPEGYYRVVKKLQGKHTRYYKALLLDYPTTEDKKRFEKEKACGRLPKGARIGGNIEIHGEGGKRAYWTEGCAALNNRDMDILYRQVKNGTPVLIVGSFRTTLEEALENYAL